jgi:hypothetical protein
MNEGIFKNKNRNIEFYSGTGNSFSILDLNLWKILINKKVKIFKQWNIVFIKYKLGKGKLQKINILKINIR